MCFKLFYAAHTYTYSHHSQRQHIQVQLSLTGLCLFTVTRRLIKPRRLLFYMGSNPRPLFRPGPCSSSGLYSVIYGKLDTGPIRLAIIVYVFNYRVAVLRDGIKSATGVGCSRRAEGRILNDTDISWGHQVAVMFQIISALALEVPTFLQNIERLRGVSPDVHLYCEPWGHVDHRDGHCGCLSSDRTAPHHASGVFRKRMTPQFILRKVVRG